MRLIFIDEDIPYLHQLQAVLSKKTIGRHDFCMFSRVSQLDQLTAIDLYQSIILIHENQREDLTAYFNQKPYFTQKERLDVLVLTEGYIYPSSVQPAIALPAISKYQHVEQLMHEIQSAFLETTKKDVAGRNKGTRLMSIFCAGGSDRIDGAWFDRWIRRADDKKALVLDFDPFSIAQEEEREKSSISHLIAWIKAGKENINLLLEETVCKKGNTHFLYGPLNMLDLECLSTEEIRRFTEILTGKLNYDALIINMAHVHINGLCAALLEASGERLLIAADEGVQMAVQRQFEWKWRILDRMDVSELDKFMNRKEEDEIAW